MTKPLDLARAQRQFRRALGASPPARARPAGRVVGAEALERDGLDGPRAQEKAARLIEAIGLPATWADPVDVTKAPGEQRHPFVLAFLGIPAGETRVISGQGCVSYTGECFAVDPACAAHFLMTPILCGNINCSIAEVGDRWLPCSVFQDWKRWDLAPMTPSNRIHFEVMNISQEARDFRAVLFGVVGRDEPFPHGRYNT